MDAPETLEGHPQPKVSKMNNYSIGVAAENKALNTFDLEVTPIEHTPMVDGEMSTNAQTYSTSGMDQSGTQYQISAPTAGSVKATWLPVGQPNRMTAPDVRRGEQVMLYQFADSDKYYWNTMRNDLAFRRLETVVFAISGTPAEGAAADQSASYFIEMSSHKKKITLSTSKANGEPYAYSFIFDTGLGKITLMDDIGNTMFLDSTENQWHIENADGSFFDMTKKAISGSAADSIDWKTKAFSIESETYELDSSASITEKTQTRAMTAQTNEITAESTHNGNLAMNGDITTAPGSTGEGDISMSGNFKLKGSAELQGSLDVQGNMTAVTIEGSESITAPNIH